MLRLKVETERLSSIRFCDVRWELMRIWLSVLSSVAVAHGIFKPSADIDDKSRISSGNLVSPSTATYCCCRLQAPFSSLEVRHASGHCFVKAYLEPSVSDKVPSVFPFLSITSSSMPCLFIVSEILRKQCQSLEVIGAECHFPSLENTHLH